MVARADGDRCGGQSGWRWVRTIDLARPALNRVGSAYNPAGRLTIGPAVYNPALTYIYIYVKDGL